MNHSSLRHDLPLVVFSTLVIAGAGIAASGPLLLILGRDDWRNLFPLRCAVVTSLLLAGMLVSLLHLGRRERAWRSIARVGRSSLSNEIVLLSLALGCAVLSLLGGPLEVGQYTLPILLLSCSCASVLLLVLLGQVYRLGGQPAWTGVTPLIPIAQGLAFGSAFHLATVDKGSATLFLLTLGLIGLDFVLALTRWTQLIQVRERARPRHPALDRHRQKLSLTRLLLANIFPLLPLLAGATTAALLFLFLGLVADRLIFYGLALERCLESEIDHVNGVLRRIGERP